MRKYGLLKQHLEEMLTAGQALGVKITRDGSYAGGQTVDSPPCGEMCLIGTVSYLTGLPHSDRTLLGLESDEKLALESGFCGWEDKNNEPDSYKLRFPELYALGSQLAKEFAVDYAAAT